MARSRCSCCASLLSKTTFRRGLRRVSEASAFQSLLSRKAWLSRNKAPWVNFSSSGANACWGCRQIALDTGMLAASAVLTSALSKADSCVIRWMSIFDFQRGAVLLDVPKLWSRLETGVGGVMKLFS